MPFKTYRFLICILLLAALTACGSSVSELKIVGGRSITANQGAEESTVALVNSSDGKTFCSGALIHEELILSSAHCLVGKNAASIEVRFFRGEVHKVKEFRTYKQEQKFGVNFDVAWLRLAREEKSYQPLEILRDPRRIVKSMDALALGYGQQKSKCDENDSACAAGELKAAELKISEYVNQGRWFHLLLTQSDKGVGACLGDSGGPLLLRFANQTYVAGNFVGWDRRLVAENKNAVCDEGASIYNFSGAYRDWIEQTSQLKLPLTEVENPPPPRDVSIPPVVDTKRFVSWCESRDESAESWYTMQRLISLAGDYALEHGGDIQRVFTDCNYAYSNLESRIKLDRGLTIDAFAPDSFGDKARITDLSPLESLAAIDIQALSLSGHAIDDFTPISFLPRLKRLEISDNLDEARVPLNVAKMRLERLTVKNSPRAIALESIASIKDLRYLTLENVRSDSDAPLNLGPKLIELTVKADLRLTLPELMPSLQNLELSGLKGLKIAHEMPKLRRLEIEESQRAADSSEALEFKDLSALEQFLFRQNRGYQSLVLPERLQKLRTLEAVGSGLRTFGDIRSFTKLSKLDLSHNNLNQLPLLEDLPLLVSLNLSENDLGDLSRLDGLQNLRSLTAEFLQKGSFRSLSSLPDLPKLEELRLSRNSFSSVHEFLRFPKLQVLTLSQNQLRDVRRLAELKELSYLEVVDNPLTVESCPLAEERFCRFEWARDF